MSAEVTSTTIMDDVDVGASTTEYEELTTIEYYWTENSYNISNGEYLKHNATHSDDYYSVFKVFYIMEIFMTSLELMVWIAAAIKMPRWRRNYRNQMLMQISVARFIKRIILSLRFLQDNHKLQSSWTQLDVALDSSQIYVDFVIVILVFFFIKHMYDSLIIVLVNIRQNTLYKVSICAWLLPAPITVVWTIIIVSKALDSWVVYLLICCIFRWPLIFMGTSVYIAILYRVLSDKIRKFARSLTVITFLMCLIVNFYLFSKDVIELWCLKSFVTILVSNMSGLIMNFLILSFYVILVSIDYKHCNQSKTLTSMPNYSIADTCKL